MYIWTKVLTTKILRINTSICNDNIMHMLYSNNNKYKSVWTKVNNISWTTLYNTHIIGLLMTGPWAFYSNQWYLKPGRPFCRKTRKWNPKALLSLIAGRWSFSCRVFLRISQNTNTAIAYVSFGLICWGLREAPKDVW